MFVQAEDGIRDLVRSRGVGDVYKRQGEYRTLVSVADVTAYRDLKDLSDRGLLVRQGKGRGAYYTLVE